jgi:hypothetical protein
LEKRGKFQVGNGKKNDKAKKHSVPGHFAIMRTRSFLRFRMFSEIAPQELARGKSLKGKRSSCPKGGQGDLFQGGRRFDFGRKQK